MNIETSNAGSNRRCPYKNKTYLMGTFAVVGLIYSIGFFAESMVFGIDCEWKIRGWVDYKWAFLYATIQLVILAVFGLATAQVVRKSNAKVQYFVSTILGMVATAFFAFFFIKYYTTSFSLWVLAWIPLGAASLAVCCIGIRFEEEVFPTEEEDFSNQQSSMNRSAMPSYPGNEEK